MLVNPGGPGGSGPRSALLGGTRAQARGRRLRLDRLRPPRRRRQQARAVLRSPTTAATTVPSTTRRRRPAWSRRGRRGPSATRRPARRRAARCCRTSPPTDAAKDLDTIRKALGAKQINFYGFSYGTYLGQVYATLFPQNLRRAVFDGVVDHRGVWYQGNLDQDVAFQKAIEVYFDWIAKNDAVYHLGNSGDAVEKLYYAERDKLAGRSGGRQDRPVRVDRHLPAGRATTSPAGRRSPTTFAKWVQKRDAAALVALYDDTASVATTTATRSTSPSSAPTRPGRSRSPGCSPTTAGGGHGAVRDVGQRLVQRALPDVEGARAASR